jgi:3-methyladenine DNA glycosylase AlkD
MPSLADAIEAGLRERGTPRRAAGEKAYLKSDLRFTGTTVSDVRAVVRRLAPRMDREMLLSTSAELWAAPVHERRAAAVFLLAGSADRLRREDLPFLEGLARASRTWALLDPLALDVVGPLVEANPDGLRTDLDRWAVDGDFWVRRASLLAELRPIRHGAPMDRFLARADAMLEEREFFIRKAIGWVLREAGKPRPDEVGAWLTPRTHRASGVTMREAVKYLPAADRDRLIAAHRERRAPS